MCVVRWPPDLGRASTGEHSKLPEEYYRRVFRRQKGVPLSSVELGLLAVYIQPVQSKNCPKLWVVMQRARGERDAIMNVD